GKPAAGLVLLREQILGPERFDAAFREYCRRWAFKHPSPVDFFRTMNDAAGEDLSWFWRGWFYTTGQLDQGVDSVMQADSSGQTFARISISNQKELVMPVKMLLTLEDSTSFRRDLPVEVWLTSQTFTTGVLLPKKLIRVEIDPEEKMPDSDRTNNTWLTSDSTAIMP
ncbi:MAG: M1 family peptidase, partial [Rhizobacter sp.]|nr:M1 family peptidase [Chlorobiales bacterium]